MKTLLFLAYSFAVLALDITFAGEIEREPSSYNPVFIETNSNQFSIGYFDENSQTICRLRGIVVPRSFLPVSGPYRKYMIYEDGEQPTFDIRDGKPPPEFYHNYGHIPYAVKDVDMPLVAYSQNETNSLIGYQVMNRFYAFSNVAVRSDELSPDTSLVRKGVVDEILSVPLPKHLSNAVLRVGAFSLQDDR